VTDAIRMVRALRVETRLSPDHFLDHPGVGENRQVVPHGLWGLRITPSVGQWRFGIRPRGHPVCGWHVLH
jgi:hypothetical protein